MRGIAGSKKIRRLRLFADSWWFCKKNRRFALVIYLKAKTVCRFKKKTARFEKERKKIKFELDLYNDCENQCENQGFLQMVLSVRKKEREKSLI